MFFKFSASDTFSLWHDHHNSRICVLTIEEKEQVKPSTSHRRRLRVAPPDNQIQAGYYGHYNKAIGRYQ